MQPTASVDVVTVPTARSLSATIRSSSRSLQSRLTVGFDEEFHHLRCRQTMARATRRSIGRFADDSQMRRATWPAHQQLADTMGGVDRMAKLMPEPSE